MVIHRKSRSDNKWVYIRSCALVLLLFVLSIKGFSQGKDSIVIDKIYQNALRSHESYQNLKQICDQAAPRELGSKNAIIAVGLFKDFLDKLDCDTVYLQQYKTEAWKHLFSSLSITSEKGSRLHFDVKALGPSVPTVQGGFEAEILEVSGMAALKSLKNEEVKGKIVFFNNLVKAEVIEPVEGYNAVIPRLYGANLASEKGAAGCIMRSISSIKDEYVHTGCMRYDTIHKKIPAVAISTEDADVLSNMLLKHPELKFNMEVQIEVQELETANVIAEIRGKEAPEEVIVIGAHIDTWYNTAGAHDDGAGCVQMIDVLRIFNVMKIANNRTIRVILFMDEEMSKSGAKAYVNQYKMEDETFIVAIESDLGGYEPCGFQLDGTESELKHLKAYGGMLIPYGLYRIEKGFGGGDMMVLKEEFGFPSLALKVNSQRYFDIIHTEKDSFDKINRRELQLGTAAITSLVYLIDKYGLN